MSALPDDLSRTRALFEHWRAPRSGREKIPKEWWQAVIALRDRYPVSQLCRELHLSAGALRARWREAEVQPVAAATPEFVPLPWEVLGLPVANRTATPTGARIRLVWERADGTRLPLLLPASWWSRAESLCQAFLPSSLCGNWCRSYGVCWPSSRRISAKGWIL
jgi:hypothetical protein